MTDRDLDLVVCGATGVTGRQVARYLTERAAETELRWAPAARDADRLARSLAEIGVRAPQPIVADVGVPSTLQAMAARARVVLNLVGPYTRYGRPVIAACVAQGTHYVDLSGEIPFVREVIDEFHAPAQAAGVKVVQVCGFEALPPDLLVLVAAERARARWQENLAEVELEVAITPPPGAPRPSDLMSGGTFQSMWAVAEAENSALIADPAALVDDATLAEAVRRVSPIELAPRRGFRGAVIAPIAPAPFINPAVIQRTTALVAAAEGRPAEPFRYREGLALDGGSVSLPARWACAGALSATQLGMRALAGAGAGVRRGFAGAFSRIGPPAGFGPSGARLEGWRWTMAARARTAGGNELHLRIEADGHPGYLTTARLLGETGMLLCEHGATPQRAGCLTPAAALGSTCLKRFERAGARVVIDS